MASAVETNGSAKTGDASTDDGYLEGHCVLNCSVKEPRMGSLDSADRQKPEKMRDVSGGLNRSLIAPRTHPNVVVAHVDRRP